MDKSKFRLVFISTLDYSGEEGLPILIPEAKISTFATKQINVTMIGMDVYRATYKLKRTEVFAISIRDMEYQAEKEARLETNPKSVVSEKYHDLSDIFSAKDSETLSSHREYDYKIILKEKQKHCHALFYKILL